MDDCRGLDSAMRPLTLDSDNVGSPIMVEDQLVPVGDADAVLTYTLSGA